MIEDDEIDISVEDKQILDPKEKKKKLGFEEWLQKLDDEKISSDLNDSFKSNDDQYGQIAFIMQDYKEESDKMITDTKIYDLNVRT